MNSLLPEQQTTKHVKIELSPSPAPELTRPPLTSKDDVALPIQEAESHNAEPPPQINKEDTVATAHLIITSPFSREPRTITLLKDEITLGRAGSSDILLDEDTITSRHHAHIKRDGENYIIYDKRSSYGVTVNDHKLEEGVGHILKEGDHIQIGDYSLLFSFQHTKNRGDSPVEHVLR